MTKGAKTSELTLVEVPSCLFIPFHKICSSSEKTVEVKQTVDQTEDKYTDKDTEQVKFTTKSFKILNKKMWMLDLKGLIKTVITFQGLSSNYC